MDLPNILQWNVRSLLASSPSLQHFFSSSKCSNAFLFETWLLPSRKFNIPHFNLFRSDRPDGFVGSATATHTSLNAQEIDLDPNLKQSFQDHKIDLIDIEVLNFKNFPLISFWSCYMSNDSKISLALISLVIDECLIYWKKARLPTHDPSYCSKKLKKLYDFWRTLEKNKSRNSDLHKQRRQDFINELNDLFDIAHVNAMSIIKINDDKKFLTLQRQRGRPGCMLGLDLKLDALEKRKEARVQNENKFREQMVETYEEFETETISSTSSEEEIQDVDNFENETIAGPSKCKRARKNLMTPRLTFALDKCKISDRDAIHIITACIEAASLNIDDFVLSRS
ncbi:hypothetical protein QTP88_005893 [Uroleucon formosanum]